MVKKRPQPRAADPAPQVAADPWVCSECGQENAAEDDLCCACECPRPIVADPRFDGYFVGLLKSVEPIPGKDKLKSCEVDVGHCCLKIVSNAPNIKEGVRVVVAAVGAIVNDEPL